MSTSASLYMNLILNNGIAGHKHIGTTMAYADVLNRMRLECFRQGGFYPEMIHVRHGKGAKDRYVSLPERTLQLLRQYWKQHHYFVVLTAHNSARIFINYPSGSEPWIKAGLYRMV